MRWGRSLPLCPNSNHPDPFALIFFLLTSHYGMLKNCSCSCHNVFGNYWTYFLLQLFITSCGVSGNQMNNSELHNESNETKENNQVVKGEE